MKEAFNWSAQEVKGKEKCSQMYYSNFKKKFYAANVLFPPVRLC